MKKNTQLVLIILTILVTTSLPNVIAESQANSQRLAQAEVTPSSTASGLIDRIERIKEMIASRVAELNLVEKRSILGTVKEASSSQITMVDIHDKIRLVDIDELTKFQSSTSNSKSFGITDFKPGDQISSIGLYNRQTKRLLARVIIKTKNNPKVLYGSISKIDPNNFTISITPKGGEEKNIDIETSTRSKILKKDGSLEKSGFSKFQIGQDAVVVGYDDTSNTNKMTGLRITHFEGTN